MEADFSNVSDALEHMKSLANSLSLFSEGRVVEYEGREFRELPSSDETWTGWASSFWYAPEEKVQESEQILKALMDLNQNFTVIQDYLRHPDIRTISKIRNDILEIKDQCQTIALDPEKYDEDVQAVFGELLSQFDHIETLLEPTFSPEYRESLIEAYAIIDELNKIFELPEATISTEGLSEEDLLKIIEEQKVHEKRRTEQEINRDIKLGSLAQLVARDDDILDELRNGADREMVRKKIEMREGGNIVCQLSQGRVDERGQAACAFISLTGAYHVLSGEEFTSERDIYRTIHEGIEAYGERSGNQPVQEAVEGVNAAFGETIVPYVPESFREGVVLNELQAMMLPMMLEDPKEFPFQKRAAEGFEELLALLEQEAAESSRVGVINCLTKDATEVKFVFPKEGRFYLFDSHGKPFAGESMGASVLSFDTLDECNAKLIDELGRDEANQYDFWFMKLETPIVSLSSEGHTA